MRLRHFFAWQRAGRKSEGRSAKRRPFGLRLSFLLASTTVALTAVLISLFAGVFQRQSAVCEGRCWKNQTTDLQGDSWPCYMPRERRARGPRFRITKASCLQKFTFVVNIVDAITKSHMCTGVIIGPRNVLAPADCVDKTVNPAADAFPFVRINSYHLSDTGGDEEVQVLVPTCRRVLHPDFTGISSRGGNIALLILQRSICCHIPEIRSIPIAQCGSKNLTSVGWFTTDEGLPSSHLEALINQWPMDHDACKAQLGELPEGVLCTTREHTAAQHWDSGAPLICNDTYLLGIASYQKTESQQPQVSGQDPQCPAVVYTDVDAYREWIDGKGIEMHTVEDSSEAECTL